MKKWQLQEAKNKFSNVFDRAIHQGPQEISRRGKDFVVMLSLQNYHKLTRPKNSLVDFFKKSPLYGENIKIKRAVDTGREIKL